MDSAIERDAVLYLFLWAILFVLLMSNP